MKTSEMVVDETKFMDDLLNLGLVSVKTEWIEGEVRTRLVTFEEIYEVDEVMT